MSKIHHISVVIPVYNREQTIRRAIQSVLRQTFPDFEIIVVDDGSTDDTAQVIQDIVRQDERLQYVYQENQGAQVARNHGLQLAHGEYVCFLDSDDEWLPTFLEKVMDKFIIDPSVGCVYCLTGLNESIRSMFYTELEGNIYQEALDQGYVTLPSSLVIKRSCFAKIGKWDTDFMACQDDDICFRLAKYFKFALIKEVLCIQHVEYNGSENRISASVMRVANGWWLLWHKYEKEVLKYCGKRTMAKHYLRCAERFKRAGNVDMEVIALQKASDFYSFDDEWSKVSLILMSKKWYCYGIGKYGQIAQMFMDKYDIAISGFVVSNGESRIDSFAGYPVFFHNELPKMANVFLTCSHVHHASIKENLTNREDIYIYTVSDELFIWMYLKI